MPIGLYVKIALAGLMAMVVAGVVFYISQLKNEIVESKQDKIALEIQTNQLVDEVQKQNQAIDALKEMERLQAAKLKAAVTNANTGLKNTTHRIGLVMKSENKPVGCEPAMKWLVDEAQK